MDEIAAAMYLKSIWVFFLLKHTLNMEKLTPLQDRKLGVLFIFNEQPLHRKHDRYTGKRKKRRASPLI